MAHINKQDTPFVYNLVLCAIACMVFAMKTVRFLSVNSPTPELTAKVRLMGRIKVRYSTDSYLMTYFVLLFFTQCPQCYNCP